MAAGIRVLTLAKVGRHDAAEKILDGLPKTPWAAELRLRAAELRGAKSVLRKAADDLLKIGPDPPARLLAARAFARLGDLGRAQAEAVGVAQSASAPPSVRAEAYGAALRFCADNNEWDRAADLYRAWSTWAAAAGTLNDERISAWQVRIYHRGYAGLETP
jgi:hypothetical protein